MTRRAVAWLPWLLAGTSLLLGLAGAVFGALNGYSPIELAREVAVGVLLAISFPLVGAPVASRRPGNPLGWIFCAIGLSEGLVTAGWEYGTYALRTRPGSVPGRGAGQLVRRLDLGPGARPAGHLRATAVPRRPAAVAALAAGGLAVGGADRQQLKWFVDAAAVTVGGVLVTELLPIPEGSALDDLVALAGLAVVPSVPVAAGVAILRYRLYEIDRIVNRTLVYAALTALLAAVYAAGALALPRLLHLGESQLIVAAATLAVAALFQPLRRRVQALVDRRFNRARYDAAVHGGASLWLRR